MQRVLAATLLITVLGGCVPASASPIGVDFLFECGECTPATADHFLGKTGPADYQLKFDGYTWYEVDVEASTISVKSLVEGTTRSPLIFKLTWSPEQNTLLSAAISPASSFQTGYSWGRGELSIDMGGSYFAQGDQIVFDLTAAAVPEPSGWWLAITGGALLWRQRRSR